MNKLDFELKLPRGYLSFSAMNQYLWDPAEYYLHYFMGKDFMKELREDDIPRWEKIRLGSIFQDAWYDPRINWKKKLKKENFTSDKERIISNALSQPNLIRMAPVNCENTYKGIKYNGIPLLIKLDGYDEKKGLLLENKFGVTRSQEMVDEDLQLSFYTMGLLLKFGKMPKRIVLQSVNDRTGKVKVIETKRNQDDLDHVGSLIVEVAKKISLGIWEK